jgi:hypothetical protein
VSDEVDEVAFVDVRVSLTPLWRLGSISPIIARDSLHVAELCLGFNASASRVPSSIRVVIYKKITLLKRYE